MIVLPHPARGMISHLLNVFPQILVQSFVAHCSIKALSVGILLWVSWLREAQRYVGLFRPTPEQFADVLRSVITSDDFGFAAPGNDLLQATDDALRRER